MMLTGVELNLRAEEKEEEKEEDQTNVQGWRFWDEDELQALWLAGRPNFLPRQLEYSYSLGGSADGRWKSDN